MQVMISVRRYSFVDGVLGIDPNYPVSFTLNGMMHIPNQHLPLSSQPWLTGIHMKFSHSRKLTTTEIPYTKMTPHTNGNRLM
jgi:hypothetical protein